MRRLICSALMLMFVVSGCALTSNPVAKPKAENHGSEAGNGGFAVVCRDTLKDISSVRVLDFYEAAVFRDTHYSLGDVSLSVADKIKLALQRLERLDAVRAASYQRKADAFLDNANWVRALDLSSTNDYGPIEPIIPSNCSIEQLCIQKKPESSTQRLYTVNIDLWDRLDADQRAGLVLHEVIYGDALEHGHKDSVRTRLFNGLLCSKKFETMSEAEYKDFIAKISMDGAAPSYGPVWVSNPIQVRACVDQPFKKDLKALVSGSGVSLTVTGGPVWIKFVDGVLSGTPPKDAFGEFRFQATGTDNNHLADSTEVVLTAVDCSKPHFPTDPIRFIARVGAEFTTNLSALSGLERMNFKMIEGPNWLTVSGEGVIKGTPQAANLGENDFTIAATNSEGLGARLIIQIVVTPTAIWKQDPIDLGVAKVGTNFFFDLRSYIVNPNNEPLTFSSTGLPGWVVMQSPGILVGTPGNSDVGDFSGITLTVSDSQQTASVTAFGTVKKVATPPHWVAGVNPLPDAHEDSPYSQNISSLVLNPENWQLSFSIVNETPPLIWLNIGAADGVLFGSPGASAAGKTMNLVIKFTATTAGQDTYEETALFEIKVIHTPHPAHWIGNPILLGDIPVGSSLEYSVLSWVHNPDGGPLVFQFSNYPKWWTVKGNLVTLHPSASDVGEYSFDAVVSTSSQNGSFTDSTTIKGRVVLAGLPRWLANPLILPDAFEDHPYSVDLSQYASDPNGNPLKISVSSLPKGMTMSGTVLTWTPTQDEIGLNKFQATAANLVAVAQTEVRVTVVHTNRPPIWSLNPIGTTVQEKTEMHFSLAGYVTNPNGGSLTFTKVDGPQWLSIAADGVASGTPTNANEGDNAFTVRATDASGLYAETKFIVTVIAPSSPQWKTPLEFPKAVVGQMYVIQLRSFLVDPKASGQLMYAFDKLPSWLSYSDDKLMGTPSENDVGKIKFMAMVTANVVSGDREQASIEVISR